MAKMLRGLNAAEEALPMDERLDRAAELLATAPGSLFRRAVLKLDKVKR
jgi:hypothetical protein